MKKLIWGNTFDNFKNKPKPAIKKQINHISSVWNSDKYNDFGLERIVRLLLACIQFIFPGLYIRHIGGKFSTLTRKISNEFYVLFKIVVYIFITFFLNNYCWLSYLCAYLIAETFCYLLGLIFLAPEYTVPASHKRNLLLVILNYLEITLGFAAIYYCSFKNVIHNMNSPIDAIYFSFISTSTIGYGDIYPISDTAKVICICQSIIAFIFTVFIISQFISNFNKSGYLNNNSKQTNSK